MIENENKKYNNLIDNYNKEISTQNNNTKFKSENINKLLEKSIQNIKKLNIEQ